MCGLKYDTHADALPASSINPPQTNIALVLGYLALLWTLCFFHCQDTQNSIIKKHSYESDLFKVVCWVRCRYARYRYGCRPEHTEVSFTVIDVVPILVKSPIPVWKSVPVPAVPVSISYRTYRSVRNQYRCRMSLLKCPVLVMMSPRTFRCVGCRY